MQSTEQCDPFSVCSNLRIAVPRGSLQKPVSAQLSSAGCRLFNEVERGGLCGNGVKGIQDNVKFHLRDRKMVPRLVESGTFQAGITGMDILIDSRAQVDVLAALPEPETKWVLAVEEEWEPRNEMIDIGSELPHFASVVIPSIEGWDRWCIVEIEGDEECALSDCLCDAVLVVTLTGSALEKKPPRPLRIVDGCEDLFRSRPVLIAKKGLAHVEHEILLKLASRLND